MKNPNPVETPRLADAKAASLAPATHEVYASAWRSWARYAQERNEPCLPAAVETLEGWLACLSAQGRSPSTIRAYRAAVAWHHRRLNPNPAHHPDMRDTLAGIARLASLEGHAPRQASPLRQHDIHRIIHTAREPRNNQPGGKPETAEQARRRGDLETAMILIAYDAALRASELLALRWSDIEPSEDSLGARVLIRRSKTDQTAKGAVAPISARTLAAVENIRPADAQPNDRIFPFSYTALNRRIKTAARAAGIDHANITTHSPRIGLAQDLAATGATMPALMLAGRWSTEETAARYIKHLAADHTPLARHHRKPPQTPPAPTPASQLSTTAIQLAKQCLELIGRRVEQAKNNLERSQQALNPRAHAEDTRAPPC